MFLTMWERETRGERPRLLKVQEHKPTSNNNADRRKRSAHALSSYESIMCMVSMVRDLPYHGPCIGRLSATDVKHFGFSLHANQARLTA